MEQNDIDSITDSQGLQNENITAERVLYLKKIYQTCKWYYWLHTMTYYHFYKIYIAIHIPMILINIGVAILNTDVNENVKYNKNIRYISAVILLMNTFFTSILNLFKIDEKLGYHKNKASDYIKLSNDIESYISFGEGLDTTLRLYKTYMSYCNDNEYIVPERIITNAEKTLHNKYFNNVDDTENIDINRTIGVSSFMYIYGLITEIKNENSKHPVDDTCPHDDTPTSIIGKVSKVNAKSKKPSMALDINHIATQTVTKSRTV